MMANRKHGEGFEGDDDVGDQIMSEDRLSGGNLGIHWLLSVVLKRKTSCYTDRPVQMESESSFNFSRCTTSFGEQQHLQNSIQSRPRTCSNSGVPRSSDQRTCNPTIRARADYGLNTWVSWIFNRTSGRLFDRNDRRRYSSMTSGGFWRLFLIPGLLLLIADVDGLPIPTSGTSYRTKFGGIFEGTPERAQIDGTTYLQRFGYLPGSDLETGALRTDDELHRAVRHFQRFANIPQTGKLDRDTVEAMTKPRCGVQDLLESHGHHRHQQQRAAGNQVQEYALGPSKWQKKWLTFRVLNFSPDLDHRLIRDAFIRAFHLWSDVTQLTFHEVQSGYADIYIQFSSGYHQDGYPFDGPGMVLAHAFFPGDERGGDIHFDEDEKWTVRSADGVDLFAVASHELGHSLGLAHSNTPGSLMFPWHQGYQENFKLHPDDIMAIQELYGAKVPHQHPPKTNPPPFDAPRSTTTTRSSVSSSSRSSIGSRTTISTRTTTTSTSRPTTTSPARTTQKTTTRRTYVKAGPETPVVPDPCHTKVDAISIIRGEIFIFIDKWFWRINDAGIMDGYPVEISRFWYGLPKDLTKIDALFERPNDGRIVFMSGKSYWEFHGNHLVSRFPPEGKPITDFGLPSDIENIDAAFVWGHNRRTYVISSRMYWRLNETSQSVDYGYPRDMSMWGGVRIPVDASFTNSDSNTYFIQGQHYWEFNNARMHVRQEHPKSVGEKWLKCSARPPTSTTPPIQEKSSSGSASPVWTWHRLSVMTVLAIFVLRI